MVVWFFKMATGGLEFDDGDLGVAPSFFKGYLLLIKQIATGFNL